MKKLSKLFTQAALAALVAGGALAAAATSASAAVVCNREGDCWHTQNRYHYPAGIVVHPNNWAWHGEHNRWREHEGRGYWRSGVWINL